MLERIECPSCKKLFDFDDTKSSTSDFSCPYCREDLRMEHDNKPLPGAKVGDYVLKSELGVGGMGTVYLAEQTSMGRDVALKILLPSLVANKSYLQRFQREIRNLANVDHPNVVTAIEAGSDGDKFFFSMTYVPGDDLKKRLEKGETLDGKEAFRIALELAKALKYAWDKHEMLHRDIKPANIIVTPSGEVKLMDLGISKRMDEDIDLTMVGMMVGSPMYISPEQARGERNLDFRSDMYSLGATLYHLLTGRPPFDGDNSVAIVSRHFSDPIPDPRRIRPELPKLATRIITNMLGKKRSDRYATWNQLIEDIETLLADSAEPSEVEKSAARSDATTISPRSTSKLAPAPMIETINGDEGSVFEFLKATSTSMSQVCWQYVTCMNYKRIAVLLALLAATLAACVWILTKSIEAERLAKVKRSLIEAEAFMEANPPPGGTVESLKMLNSVVAAGIPEYTAKARLDIDSIVKMHTKAKEVEKLESVRRDLEELRRQARACENKGDLGKALEIWQGYQEKGQFAKELKIELDLSINLLKAQKASQDSRTRRDTSPE